MNHCGSVTVQLFTKFTKNGCHDTFWSHNPFWKTDLFLILLLLGALEGILCCGAFFVTIDEISSYSSFFFPCLLSKNKFAACILHTAFLSLVLASQMWAKYSKLKINKARNIHLQIENESSLCKLWSPFLKLPELIESMDT